MSDLITALVTAAFTAAFGVVVFVLGQFALKYVIEPIQEYRVTVGNIAYTLLFYANVGPLSAPDEIAEAQKHLRSLSGRLNEHLEVIPLYGVFVWLGLVRNRQAVLEAATQFIGWSNGLRDERTDNRERRRAIAECLNIKGVY